MLCNEELGLWGWAYHLCFVKEPECGVIYVSGQRLAEFASLHHVGLCIHTTPVATNLPNQRKQNKTNKKQKKNI